MLAYRLLEAQTQPAFQDVPDPHAGPGQVVVRVAGSGLCHTDFTVIGRDRTSCLPCHQAIKTRDFIFSTYTR
jgi:D-arabinose 1-dehydrogenase-like Zn-dependent alcohol dehydrogenase